MARVLWSEPTERRIDLIGVALTLIAIGCVVAYFASAGTISGAVVLVPAALSGAYGVAHLTKRQVRR